MSREGELCSKGLHRLTVENTLLEKNGRGKIYMRCRKCRNAYFRAINKNPSRRQAEVARSKRRIIPPLAADDPRHGTVAGYNAYPPGAARCNDCIIAINTYHRVRRLRKKARAQGIPEHVILQLVGAPSSSSISTATSFEDRLVGSTFDDPTADAALERVG